MVGTLETNGVLSSSHYDQKSVLNDLTLPSASRTCLTAARPPSIKRLVLHSFVIRTIVLFELSPCSMNSPASPCRDQGSIETFTGTTLLAPAPDNATLRV